MEGLGFPVVEAMACGTTPVVSDRGALPDVVGDAGVVTPPEAPAIEEALAALLADDDRRAFLAGAAHERVSAYTWPRTAGQWLAVLEAAAG
jgi:glycosyltransferase involved in cell wall biosynthesis